MHIWITLRRLQKIRGFRFFAESLSTPEISKKMHIRLFDPQLRAWMPLNGNKIIHERTKQMSNNGFMREPAFYSFF